MTKATPSFGERQLQIARMVADGKKQDAIAAELGISSHTVHITINKIYEKTGVHCIAELVRWLIRNGLVEP